MIRKVIRWRRRRTFRHGRNRFLYRTAGQVFFGIGNLRQPRLDLDLGRFVREARFRRAVFRARGVHVSVLIHHGGEDLRVVEQLLVLLSQPLHLGLLVVEGLHLFGDDRFQSFLLLQHVGLQEGQLPLDRGQLLVVLELQLKKINEKKIRSRNFKLMICFLT